MVNEYESDLRAAGLRADKSDVWGARAFFSYFGSVDGWHTLTLKEQLAVNVKIGRFVAWMITSQRLVPTAEYVIAHRPLLGRVMQRTEAEFFSKFQTTARTLGFNAKVIMRQWGALAQVAAVCGKRPQELSHAELDRARAALCDAGERLRGGPQRSLRDGLFGAEAVLFHAGVTDELPRKRVPSHASERAVQWAAVAAKAPTMAATMTRYVEQVKLSLKPSTVVNADAVLREFASFVVERFRDVTCVTELRRSHVEAYKLWLAERDSNRGGKLHRHTIRDRLKGLRCFFNRVIEWGWEDAPVRPLLFASDLPIKDEPLPRFLDDPAAAKLLRAARNDDDPFVRVAVELLARTGLRKGELLALTVDAVVQIGSAYWLRVPVGKLHNDRYIPLHPQLKELLDEWLSTRPAELRSDLMFVDHGRPIGAHRVDAAVAKAACSAGLKHASPHQLRHTLATQAINRGMSLEAIAALLGHRSLRMTLVYARIADRTVAEEYFAVSEKVEALYGQPQELPADAEGSEMAKLRREMNRRMLGNGWCARPVEMDCTFESICESCSFFVTTVEFKPTLERQRDDAEAKGQVGRQNIFDGLLSRLEEDAS
ncbi:MAG: tyrosine-type recombinase/integrase [Acidimicrobiales bacterium]